MTIGKKHENTNVRLEDKEIKLVSICKYLECVETDDMRCSKMIRKRKAMVKDAFNRMRNLL